MTDALFSVDGFRMSHLMWRELLDASKTGMAEELLEYGLDKEGKGTEQYERFRNIHLVVRKLYYMSKEAQDD